MKRKKILLVDLERLKRLGMTISLLLFSMLMFAQTFEVDGILFKLVDNYGYGTYEAYVTKGGNYSGHIEIPEKVTYKGNSYMVRGIGEGAFEHCNELTSVTIPSSLWTIEQHAFFCCTGLTSLIIPGNVREIGEFVFSFSGIKSLSIEEGVKTIGDGSFRGCENLTSVTLPSSMKTVSYSLFSWCTGLTSVSFGKGIETIEDEAFTGCTNLESITIPGNVRAMRIGAFQNCGNLKTITFEYSNTYALIFGNPYTLYSRVFYGCPIETVNIYRVLDYHYGNGNSPFEDMRTLKNVIFGPGSVIMDGLFKGCTNLTSITFGKAKTIGSYAFYNCKGIQSLNLPKELEKIGEYAFAGCTGLTSLSIGADIRGGELGGRRDLVVYNHAFDYCTGLKTLHINSISAIKQYAFGGCTSLEDIYSYDEHAPSIYPTSFDEKTIQDATLHVPEPSLTTESEYKNDYYWKDFQHIVIDLPSGINVIENESENASCIYDLQGRKVSTPQSGRLYIKNGKKFVGN